MDPQHSGRRDTTTPPLPPLPPSPASSSEPHQSHEGAAPAPAPPPAPTPAPMQPTGQATAFRKAIPLPAEIVLPPPAHIGGFQVFQQSPVSTPSILKMPSPQYPASPQEPANSQAFAGPSSAEKGKQRASQYGSSDEGHPFSTPGSDDPTIRRFPTATQGYVGDGENANMAMPTTSTSIRRPTRAGSNGRPADRRSVVLVDPPHGNGLTQDLSPSAHISRHSIIDHAVPLVSAGAAPTPPPGNGHRRRQSMALSAGTLNGTVNGEKTVQERLQPTLDSAEAERDRAALKAKAHAWALNCAIGAQVVLGALTTGVAAATSGRQTSIATSVLGGMSTLAASYLAKARGSGEPELSTIKCRELESFIRDCKAFMLDKGYLTGSEYDQRIERYRRRFEEIMGNASGGVADQVRAQTQSQKEKTSLSSSSPV